MMQVRGKLAVGVTVLLLAAAAWAIPQDKFQQKCINKINKDTIAVEAVQGKLDAGCIKDAVKVGSSTIAETCINSDPAGKVAKKAAITNKDNTNKCASINPQPDFAYTSPAIVNTAAIQAERDLIHDVFGSPLDAGLFKCDVHPLQCLCQRQVVDRVEKLGRAMSGIFVKCKNAALAIGHDPFPLGATQASDIAECVTNAAIPQSVQADTKTKISTAQAQLLATWTQFCHKTSDDEFHGGVCPGLLGSALTDCLAQRVRCRFCRMVDTADALAINCATWSGGSCP